MMMNRFIFYSIWLFQFFSLCAEPLQISMQGLSVVLINAESNAILFEKEAKIPRYPASTTKVATALYALKLREDALDQTLVVEQDALLQISHENKKKRHYQVPSYRLEPDGSHIGLKVGEQMNLRDLLGGLLIASGNDAANVIAQGIKGAIPQFMEDLNLYLQSLGCQQTRFCNPHGLHHPDHQTTAYDLALMTKEALKYPIFRQIVLEPRYLRPKTNKQAAVTLLQTNKLVRAGPLYYSKAIGVKTGYHSKAKHTLVAAAHFQERTLIAVLLGYQDRKSMFEEAVKLFETAFNQQKVHRQFVKSGNQPFTQNLPKSHRLLETYLAEPLTLAYYPAEDPQAKCFLHWHPLTLPISKDQPVGELQLVSARGETLKAFPLLALEEVHMQWTYKVLDMLSRFWVLALIGISGFLGLLYFWRRR